MPVLSGSCFICRCLVEDKSVVVIDDLLECLFIEDDHDDPLVVEYVSVEDCIVNDDPWPLITRR